MSGGGSSPAQPRLSAGPTLAIGGLGADSHSIGLFVLTRALSSAGFGVVELGIQNDFGRFAAVAGTCDAVLVSNMDGHARHYLAELDRLPGGCIWYLGGHPDMGGRARELGELGFARIYGDYVDPDEVIGALREDLAGRRPRRAAAAAPPRPPVRESIRGRREEVLAQWPTGAAARDLEDNARVLAGRPSLTELQLVAEAPLLHPRSGVAGVAAQCRLFEQLAGAGAEVLSFQIDSMTRCGHYGEVEQVLRRGGELNGFPLVNHGAAALRRLSQECPLPLQTRHSAKDPRLLAELSYAGGVTSFEGGAICYNVPYYADLPLTVSLERWRYVDRLTARYAELGVILDREFFGTLTATLLPPCLPIVTNLLEALLAAEVGVRSVSLAYAEQGCRAQDIAAIEVMGRLGREFLADRGVRVATVFHQYMGAFPRHEEDAAGLIEASAETATLAGADRIVVKAPCEAAHIPAAADNAAGLRLAARGVDRADGAPPLPAAAEAEAIEATSRALLGAVLSLRPGDTGACVVEAFDRGYLDVPFSPSRFNAGRMLAARDRSGAVRIVDPGSMPLPTEAVARDAERIGERLREAGLERSDSWRLVADDVMRSARERMAWPLDAVPVG